MGYPNQDQALKDGNTSNTIAPGKSANVVLTDYVPFSYGPNKDKTMPKHLGTDAESGQAYEFVGFQFHDAWKGIAEVFEPGVTVIHVKALENGTKYCDYELTVVAGTEKKADATKSAEPPF